ncbi:MAG: hypothetical protein P8Z76_13965 [Alphaproteobacteria bacterium]
MTCARAGVRCCSTRRTTSSTASVAFSRVSSTVFRPALDSAIDSTAKTATKVSVPKHAASVTVSE